MDCILKPTKLLDCAHIGVCVVIRSNIAFILDRFCVPAISPLYSQRICCGGVSSDSSRISFLIAPELEKSITKLASATTPYQVLSVLDIFLLNFTNVLKESLFK